MAKIKWSRKKKTVAAVMVLAAVAAAGAGFFFLAPGGGEAVGVYPFHYLGMTEYWGDNQESYGPVSSDNIQTVFLSDSQIITEIKVKEGDQVKKGDVLMTYDTTLSSLSLERKRLDVEKIKLNLEIAQRELGDILMLEPMEEPEWTAPPEETEPDLGREWEPDDFLSDVPEYDGTTQEKALICWINNTTRITQEVWDTIVGDIFIKLEKLQQENGTADDEEEDEEEDTGEEDEEENVLTVLPGAGPEGRPAGDGYPFPPGFLPGEDEDEEEEEEEAEEEESNGTKVCYVVFKMTQDNMTLGSRTLWAGMELKLDGEGAYSFRLYDASAFQDYTQETDQSTVTVVPEYKFGYTIGQIVQMKNAKEKEIKQLEFNLKMEETEYKIMQSELEDGNVCAQVDGTVVSVLPEEEARSGRQPLIKVSGGGGFYVSCSITELEKDNLVVGQEVTVNDWNTGMTYTGTVDSVGDFPSSQDGWNGMGNPNTTYYPFTVFIDGSADLQTYSYVSVMYSTSEAENGIYLENAFLRTEQGRSYVYVLGPEDTLEKRYVTTGKSLYGSYTEILSGITEEDLLAFPYGKNVKEGAPAVEKDISELYSY